jgi:hypothetical protein
MGVTNTICGVDIRYNGGNGGIIAQRKADKREEDLLANFGKAEMKGIDRSFGKFKRLKYFILLSTTKNGREMANNQEKEGKAASMKGIKRGEWRIYLWLSFGGGQINLNLRRRPPILGAILWRKMRHTTTNSTPILWPPN